MASRCCWGDFARFLLAHNFGCRENRQRTAAQRTWRPLVEQLEARQLLTHGAADNPEDVTDSRLYANRATVSLRLNWDTDGTPGLTAGDDRSYCSGALIDNYHVLTAAHCLFGHTTDDHPGWVDFVVVQAGRDGTFNRPFGEALMTARRVDTRWQAEDSNSWKYDLGILTVDRNLGQFTGVFNYETIPDTVGELRPVQDPAVPGTIYLPFQDVPNRPQIEILHYAADGDFDHDGVDDYDGKNQLRSAGKVKNLTRDVISYDKLDIWTEGGSSGSPVFINRALQLNDILIGVHVRGTAGDPGDAGGGSATRITDAWITWIDNFISTRAAFPPTDLPALVDHDQWFNLSGSAAQSTISNESPTVGDSVTLSARVFNAGTAAATNVKVRFRLSSDNTYDSSDRLIGDASIPRISPFESESAVLNWTVPLSLTGGRQNVVWSIDYDDAVQEFDVRFHDLVVTGGNLHDSNFGAVSSRINIKNEKPKFNPDMGSSPLRVDLQEGVEFVRTFSATDPEGQPIVYSLQSAVPSGATINSQTGVLRFEPGPNTAGSIFFLTVSAFDGANRTRQEIDVYVKSGTPSVGSVTVSPSSFPDDATVPVTFNAFDVKSGIEGQVANGTEFYLDLNRNGRLDLAADGELLPGADTRLNNGQAIGGVAPGNYTLYARAFRNSPRFKFWSPPVSTQVTVIAAPPAAAPVAIPIAAHVAQQGQVAQSLGKLDYPYVTLRDSQGDVFAFWDRYEVNLFDTPTVMMRRFSADGVAETGEVALSGAVRVYDVAMRSNGDFIVVWHTEDPNADRDLNIEARRYTRDGTPVGGTMTLVVGPLGDRDDGARQSVAIEPSGNFVLAWSAGDEDEEQSFGRRFAWDGTPLGTAFRLSTANVTGQRLPDIAMAPDGRFVTVWQDLVGGVPAPTLVRGRRYDAGGSPIGTEFIVNSVTDNEYDSPPHVAINSSGEFVVAFDGRSGTNPLAAFARSYGSDGNPRGPEFRANTSLTLAGLAQVALSDSGLFVVGWEAAGLDPGDGTGNSGVYAQVFEGAGIKRGPQFRVPVVTASNQHIAYSVGLAIDADGDFTVSWQNFQFPPRQSDIYFRNFNVNIAPKLTNITPRSINVGETIGFAAIATDIDRPAQSLTFSLTGDVPAGATINPTTGVFSWTPTAAQGNRRHIFNVKVTDNGSPSLSTEGQVSIQVDHPDIALQGVTANGNSELTLTYQIRSASVAPFDVQFLRSADETLNGSPVLLGSITLNDPADLTVGNHTKTFTIGAGPGQVPLPGAGVPETIGDYRILAVADPADGILENDAHATLEDNLVVFSGVYHTPASPVMIQGTPRIDVVTLAVGSVVVGFNAQTYTYTTSDVPSVRMRLGAGPDTVLASAAFAQAIAVWAGSGDDTITGGAGDDFVNGGSGTNVILGSLGNDTLQTASQDFAPPTLTPIGTTSDTTPTIAWTTVPGAVSYELWLAQGGQSQFINNLTALTYTPALPLAGGSWQARIRAFDAEGQVTDWSVALDFLVDVPVPAAPTITSPSGTVTAGRPRFTWNPVQHAVAYELLSVVIGVGQDFILLTDTKYVPDFPLPEGELIALVRAINSQGEASVWSSPTSVMITVPIPETPLPLAPLGTIADTSPVFLWLPAAFADSFELIVDRTTPGAEQTAILHATNLPAESLEPGSWLTRTALRTGEYSYRVRATNSYGEVSPWSAPASFTIDLGVLPPTVPTILTVPEGDSLQPLSFAWSAEAQAATYQLELLKVTPGGAVSVFSTQTPSADLSVHHVFDVGEYQARVRASNTAGTTPWSEAAGFSVSVAPGWQNPRDPLDVNRDQFISPIDAVLVINALNGLFYKGALLPVRPSTDPPAMFLDVDGDNHVSPIDAVLVINWLISHPVVVAAQGESSSPTAMEAVALDEAASPGTASSAFALSSDLNGLIALLASEQAQANKRRRGGR